MKGAKNLVTRYPRNRKTPLFILITMLLSVNKGVLYLNRVSNLVLHYKMHYNPNIQENFDKSLLPIKTHITDTPSIMIELNGNMTCSQNGIKDKVFFIKICDR